MRLVVDELPCGCASCLFFGNMWCPLLRKPAPDSHASRLKGCPLVTDKQSAYEEESYEFTEED